MTKTKLRYGYRVAWGFDRYEDFPVWADAFARYEDLTEQGVDPKAIIYEIRNGDVGTRSWPPLGT